MECKFKVGDMYRVHYEGFEDTLIVITKADNYGCKYRVLSGECKEPYYFTVDSPFAGSLELASTSDICREIFIRVCVELSEVADRLEDLEEALADLFNFSQPTEKNPALYNAKVVCTNSNGSLMFEKGVIYTIENGTIKGHESQFDEPIESIDYLNRRSVASFVEVVE